MNKSYDALVEEHKQSIIELAKQQKKVASLANSLIKKGRIKTYTLAHSRIGEAVWHLNLLTYIDSVEKHKDGAKIGTWTITPSKIFYSTRLVVSPTDPLLTAEFITDSNLISQFLANSRSTAENIVNHCRRKRNG
jgi:hypothetical protein